LKHPSFQNPHVIITKPPYESNGEGWGFFTISVLVALKAGYYWVHPHATSIPDGQSLLPLHWTLNFEGSLKQMEFKVEVGVS
jgi:hypothetical protein